MESFTGSIGWTPTSTVPEISTGCSIGEGGKAKSAGKAEPTSAGRERNPPIGRIVLEIILIYFVFKIRSPRLARILPCDLVEP